MKFVIAGLGSIGTRHKKILEALGHEVIPCHRDDNLSLILKESKPDGVLVCNLNNLHIRTGLEVIKNGCPLFMEKPLSLNLKGVKELVDLAKKKKLVMQVGYVLRFNPGLLKIKKQLEDKIAGEVYAAQIEVGTYMPSWVPNQDYKKRYHSRGNLGGGVVGDLSHELDYSYWLFGKVKKVMAIVKHIPKLEIETEAMASILMEHDSGVISEVHLDYLQKEVSRNLKVIGENKNLYWDYLTSESNSNEKFENQIKNFINSIKGKENPRVTGEDGWHIQQIIEAVKESSKKGKMIRL